MSMLLDHDATAARRLAHLTIIVDGAGPAVDAVDRAARGVGMTRLVSGAYAAEPAHWTGPPAPAAIVFVGQGPLQAAVVAAPWWRAGVVHLPLRLHPRQRRDRAPGRAGGQQLRRLSRASSSPVGSTRAPSAGHS